MTPRRRATRMGSLLVVLAICAGFAGPARAEKADARFLSRDADVDGVKLHYTTGGHGPAVVLLHGYAETSRMWTPILPVLGAKFTVIAPDLPGIGDSSIPADGLDMKTSAMRIHALVRSLGVTKARVVGHDIGLMVAYAYAALFPAEVEKLVVMDAFLPGVGGWEAIYNDPIFGISGLTGPRLRRWCRDARVSTSRISGMIWQRTRTARCPEADRRGVHRRVFASRPDEGGVGLLRCRSCRAARISQQLSQTKLTMPVLSIAGEKSMGDALGQQMKLVATDVDSVVLKDAGHWIMEERPKETTAALVGFL